MSFQPSHPKCPQDWRRGREGLWESQLTWPLSRPLTAGRGDHPSAGLPLPLGCRGCWTLPPLALLGGPGCHQPAEQLGRWREGSVAASGSLTQGDAGLPETRAPGLQGPRPSSTGRQALSPEPGVGLSTSWRLSPSPLQKGTGRVPGRRQQEGKSSERASRMRTVEPQCWLGSRGDLLPPRQTGQLSCAHTHAHAHHTTHTHAHACTHSTHTPRFTHVHTHNTDAHSHVPVFPWPELCVWSCGPMPTLNTRVHVDEGNSPAPTLVTLRTWDSSLESARASGAPS